MLGVRLSAPALCILPKFFCVEQLRETSLRSHTSACGRRADADRSVYLCSRRASAQLPSNRSQVDRKPHVILRCAARPADLARALDPLPEGLEFDFVRAASYRGTESSGAVALEVPRALSVAGRHVLLVRTGASGGPLATDRHVECSIRSCARSRACMHTVEAKQHGGTAAARTAGRLGGVPDARRPCRPGTAAHACT